MKSFTQKGISRFSAALIVCSLLIYTSCKKTSVTTTTTKQATAPGTDDVAKQVAQNFYKALTGGYSGLNINDGINASFNITTNHTTHVLNSTKNALCGYTIDTSYNAGSKKGDTTYTSSGTFHFTYTCSANNVDGYRSSDTAKSVVTDSATFTAVNNITQDYVVVATDNTYKRVLTNGTIGTTSNYGISAKEGNSSGFYYRGAQYHMINVKVDVSSGVADAVSGSATFQMQLVDEPPAKIPTDGNFYDYTGTITYIGNHLARVSVRDDAGHTTNYQVNMLTGATTPI